LVPGSTQPVAKVGTGLAGQTSVPVAAEIYTGLALLAPPDGNPDHPQGMLRDSCNRLGPKPRRDFRYAEQHYRLAGPNGTL
jgi:hypothetical protein